MLPLLLMYASCRVIFRYYAVQLLMFRAMRYARHAMRRHVTIAPRRRRLMPFSLSCLRYAYVSHMSYTMSQLPFK